MSWREKVEEIRKKYWGLLPLLVVLICVALVKAIQALTGDTLRSVPSLILMGFGICSVAVALVWASVNSFLEIDVYYYQYKNPFFYGKRMAEEWYGSGGTILLFAGQTSKRL